MKPCKNRLTRFFYLILGLFGAGASSCVPVVMYGTPYATFSLKGRVVNEDGKPIGGLQIVLGNRQINSETVIYDESWIPIDTLYTDFSGQFELTDKHIFPARNIQIDVHDIDGEKNGGKYDDTSLVFKDIEYKGGDGWYNGNANLGILEIILKKQEQEQEQEQ